MENKKSEENRTPNGVIRFEDFLEHTDDILYSFEIDKGSAFTKPVKFVSRKTSEILGHTAEEFAENGEIWFNSLHPDDIGTVTESTNECIEKGVPVTRNYRFKHGRTGKYVYLEDKIVPKEDDKGNIIALFGVARDVSPRIALEKQLNQAQKVQALGELAASIAHELSNVLSPLVGYPDIILAKLPEDTPVRSAMETLRDSADRASVITQDLLTFSKRSIYRDEVLNLNEFIKEYLRSQKCEAFKSEYPDIRISIDLGSDLKDIKGSATHLQNAFDNLLNNAAEATVGAGEISIKTENCMIETPINGVMTIPEGEFVVVTLSDKGTGISSVDMERIFEPFYTKKPLERKGTGLGLFIVQGIIQDHKGFIDAVSTEKQGTSFSLYFPVTSQKRGEQKEEPPAVTALGSGNILVVDNEVSQREMMKAMLGSLGYECSTLASGEEGLEFIAESKVDLLILDVLMDSGISGIETFKRIRENYPDQKVIILSGFKSKETLEEISKIGPCRFMSKPCTLDQLGSAIKDELG